MFLKKYANGEEYYNRIYMFFNLFIALSLAPFCYLLLLRQSNRLNAVIDEGVLRNGITFSLLTVTIALLLLATNNFVGSLKSLNRNLPFRDQLNYYLERSLRKFVSCFLSQMLCVVGLYVTNSSFFVVVYILSVTLQSIKRPTLNAIIKDLALSQENQDILIEKKEIN